MITPLERYATPEEMRQLQEVPAHASQINTCADKKPFVFFAAFDGTNHSKGNLVLQKGSSC